MGGRLFGGEHSGQIPGHGRNAFRGLWCCRGLQVLQLSGHLLLHFFGFFCGHGIGLEARDYPTFTRPVTTDAPFLPGTLDLPLEENMVVSVELPYGELGLGGFQIEYTLLITSTGAEKLYPHSRELRIC